MSEEADYDAYFHSKLEAHLFGQEAWDHFKHEYPCEKYSRCFYCEYAEDMEWTRTDDGSIDIPLKNHPSLSDCELDECTTCGFRDCLTHCAEHYWHDGCPNCRKMFLDISKD